MHKARILKVVVVLALVAGASAALAQGIPTGSISGRVENEGQGLPGVSVTAKSPNLQGVRTTVTSVNGDYYFANLPPGEYTIRMELSGFSPHEETVRVGASQKVTVNAVMSLKAVEASATVIARSEQVSTSAADAATYTSRDDEQAPGRADADLGGRPRARASTRTGRTAPSRSRARARSRTSSWSTARTSRTTSAARRTTSSSRTPSRRRRRSPPASRPSSAASPAASSTRSRSRAATTSPARSAPR